MDHPDLLFYYRNMAMLSRETMDGIGLNTRRFEESDLKPGPDEAVEIVRYLNGIISQWVKENGVSPTRHLEMLYVNIASNLTDVRTKDRTSD
jgi:hypothetical protein